MSMNMVESHDSCYSICSEKSHNSLSQDLSDSIAKEIAQPNVNNTESSTIDIVTEQYHLLLRNIDFATRLGYSVEQLETVLGKLGMNARQDQILDELIKLGRGMMDRGSEVIENKPSSTHTTELCSIVIDGSNIAMTHGRKEVFSCRGIRECVQFFRSRGHTDIIVFVPQFRREIARSDCPITDQYILFELEKENVLIWTPSRRINGRRIVCHDDRYILKTAEEKNAVIVSNDEYRDLIKENPQYRTLVDERLLMYSFVDGKFMPPDDPLGRYGPKLSEFLTKGNRQFQSQVCPYGRRCTYGNKCKYYHPERPNGIHISVTDRLMKGKQRKQSFSACISRPMVIPDEHEDHPTITRTQNLNVPTSEKTIIRDDDKGWTHQIRNHYCLTLSNYSSEIMCSKPYLPLTPVIRCNPSATNVTSYCCNRTATLPIYHLFYPYIRLPYLVGNRLSPNDGLSSPQCFIPNSGTLSDAYGMQTIKSSQLLIPSTTVWSESKLTLTRPPSEPTYPAKVNERHRLQNRLCQLFPKKIVLTVMEAFPDESNPQQLCPRIIAELQKDHGNA